MRRFEEEGDMGPDRSSWSHRGVWDLALKYTLTELLLRTINWLETPLGLTTPTATGPVRGFAR